MCEFVKYPDNYFYETYSKSDRLRDSTFISRNIDYKIAEKEVLIQKCKENLVDSQKGVISSVEICLPDFVNC